VLPACISRPGAAGTWIGGVDVADSSPKKAGRHVVTIVETRTWNIEVERDDDSVGNREPARSTALMRFTGAKAKGQLPHDGHPEITAQWMCTIGYDQLGGDAPAPVPAPAPKPKGDDDHHEDDHKPKPKQDD
jgi:hypothetical protein